MNNKSKSPENSQSSHNKNHLPHNNNNNNNKFVAPSLDDEFYARSYELRKAASTMTVVAIDWFRHNLTVLLEEIYRRSHQNEIFLVLSIGSGEGNIDIEILHSLIGIIGKRSRLMTMLL